jgi:hypothetical protein
MGRKPGSLYQGISKFLVAYCRANSDGDRGFVYARGRQAAGARFLVDINIQ